MKAKQIIQDICMEFAVDPDELLNGGCRRGIISAARGAAILRMKEHFSLRKIAQLLNVHASTISYHTYQARRENVRRNALASHARRKAVAA